MAKDGSSGRKSLRAQLSEGRKAMQPTDKVSCYGRQEEESALIVTGIPEAIIKRAYFGGQKSLSGKALGFTARKNSVIRYRTKISEADVETFGLDPADAGLELVLEMGCTITPSKLSAISFEEYAVE
jgi:hypothetical protein